MTESITHEQIMERVQAVEGQVRLLDNSQTEMCTQLKLVRHEAQEAVQGVANNRTHFDEQLTKLRDKQSQTHIMLEKHVVEVNTTHKTIIGMGKGLIGVVGFGVTLLTLLELIGK